MMRTWSQKAYAVWHKRHGSDGLPPNLDELFGDFVKKIKKHKSGQGSGQGSGEGSRKDLSPIGGFILLGALCVFWFVSGVFIVAPAERAAVLKFGAYQETVGPGIHWIPSIIKSRQVVNVQRIQNFSYGAEMLTKDENIVDVLVSVQYRVQSIRDFLYNVVYPINSMEQATASALRQVVGNTKLDDILTTGRAVARDQVEEQINKILALYQPGIEVTDVNLQPAKPPEQVTAAFDDAIKAREDEQRYINKAKAYVERVVPIAKGQAARITQQADASRQRLILQADTEIAPFMALLPEYQRAPEATRQRLYLSTLEKMMSENKKVFMDTKSNNAMFYLPLDQMMKGHMTRPPALPEEAVEQASASEASTQRVHDVSARRRAVSMRRGYSQHRFSGGRDAG
jgi:modulator of FtsH protease HflK